MTTDRPSSMCAASVRRSLRSRPRTAWRRSCGSAASDPPTARPCSVISRQCSRSRSKMSSSCRVSSLVEDPHHELLVQAQAADVHVHRADSADHRVDRDGLGVEEAGLVEVDVRAGAQQRLVVGLGRPEGQLLVDQAGHHEAQVDPGEGGVDHGVVDALVGHEVGRLDVQRAFGLGDGDHVRAAAGLPGVLDRVRDDLREDLPVELPGRRRGQVAVLEKVVVLVFEPAHGEQLLELGDRLSGDAQVGVAPAREALAAVDVLLAHVHAAGVADDAVDHDDLAVVAVVQLEEVLDVGTHLGACGRQPLQLVLLEADAADVVVEDAHLDAGRQSVEQDLRDLRRQLVLLPDEVLHVDERCWRRPGRARGGRTSRRRSRRSRRCRPAEGRSRSPAVSSPRCRPRRCRRTVRQSAPGLRRCARRRGASWP